MDTISDAILSHILSFLDPYSLGQCRLVSRRFYRLSTDPSVIQNFSHAVIDHKMYLAEEIMSNWSLFDTALCTSSLSLPSLRAVARRSDAPHGTDGRIVTSAPNSRRCAAIAFRHGVLAPMSSPPRIRYRPCMEQFREPRR